MTPQRILIVEDEALVALDLEEHLLAMGHEVCAQTDSAADALAATLAYRPAVALIDIGLRGGDGVELARRLRSEHDVATIFLTAHGDPATVARAATAEPFGYLLKPYDPRELQAVIETAASRHRAESKLRQESELATAKRLEGLGRLAGGVAHDFSNLLTPILSNVSLARRRMGAEDPNHALLLEAETAARKAAELCHQMLAYAGRAPLARSRVDLARLVRDMHRLLRVTTPPLALLRVFADQPVPPVLCDRAQLRQAVMNVVTNAAEALRDGRGTVTVRVRADAARDPARPWVVVEVSDDGCGMEPDTLARMAEPFFSTKAPGRGLGLAATDGVLRSHGGALEVSTEVGRGTTVRIALPTVEGSAERSIAPVSSTPRFLASGVALVVDDEDMVRRVAGRFLTASGFDVVEAANGVEAIERAREHAGRLRVVILDVMMPVMDGIEALGLLQQITAAPVILVSGYAEQDVRARLGDRVPAAFLSKPFDGTSFLRTVEQVFRRRPR